MNSTASSLLRIVCTILATWAVGFPAIWGALALWYAMPGGQLVKGFCILLWAGFSAGMLLLVWHGRMSAGLIPFAVLFAAILTWWLRVPPTNDALWADEVARITTGTLDGNRLTLHDVRNFDWRTKTDYTQRWETRTYDLDRLRTADMILSYWSGRAIAHMLISFGFAGGTGCAVQTQVAFSVEVRRKRSQEFSEVGGFFKEFELCIIAADELDVVRLRTNVRGEKVYLYRLRLTRAAMRALFLGYVSEANRVALEPRFYNTITVNCTTLVYRMMRRIVGDLPLSYRLLFSGYMPEYAYAVGGLDRRWSLDELRARGFLSDRARRSTRPECFCADIRAGIPGIRPTRVVPATAAVSTH
jgi:hypothetical protein